jgi:hypothetical protein
MVAPVYAAFRKVGDAGRLLSTCRFALTNLGTFSIVTLGHHTGPMVAYNALRQDDCNAALISLGSEWAFAARCTSVRETRHSTPSVGNAPDCRPTGSSRGASEKCHEATLATGRWTSEIWVITKLAYVAIARFCLNGLSANRKQSTAKPAW